MTIAIKQAISEKAKSGGGTLFYIVRGSTDYAAVRDLLLETTPATYNAAPVSGYEIDAYDDAWDIWTCRADYSIPSVTPPHEKTGTVFISHDTSGGNVHISQSLQTTHSYCVPCLGLKPTLYEWSIDGDGPGNAWTVHTPGTNLTRFPECEDFPPGIPEPEPQTGTRSYGMIRPKSPLPPGTEIGPAPDMGGAINVSKDGIEGTDIPTSEKRFTFTLYVDRLTRAQMEALDNACQCVNLLAISNWPCPNYPAGEVRFESWTANDQGRENIELRLTFVREPNRIDLTVGDISGIEKKGHEYLWVYYQEVEDTTFNKIIKRPIYCYIEKVFFDSDFAIIDELITAATFTNPDEPR